VDEVKKLLEDGASITAAVSVRRPDRRQDQAEVQQYEDASESEHQDPTVDSGKNHACRCESASGWSGSMHWWPPELAYSATVASAMLTIAGPVVVRHRLGRPRSMSGLQVALLLLVAGRPYTVRTAMVVAGQESGRGRTDAGRGSRPVVGNHQS
jgi:hypothetical protein